VRRLLLIAHDSIQIHILGHRILVLVVERKIEPLIV